MHGVETEDVVPRHTRETAPPLMIAVVSPLTAVVAVLHIEVTPPLSAACCVRGRRTVGLSYIQVDLEAEDTSASRGGSHGRACDSAHAVPAVRLASGLLRRLPAPPVRPERRPSRPSPS